MIKILFCIALEDSLERHEVFVPKIQLILISQILGQTLAPGSFLLNTFRTKLHA